MPKNFPTSSAIGNPQEEYTDKNFVDLQLADHHIYQNTFETCAFQKCHFEKTTFENCSFIDCTIEKTNLALASFSQSTFSNVQFIDSKLTGIDWTQANTTLFSVNFHHCLLDYSFFYQLPLKGIRLTQCSAKEVSFEESDLSEADLTQSDFLGANFLDTKLIGSDLRGAKNIDVDITSGKLRQARMWLADAGLLLQRHDIIIEDFQNH